MTAGINVSLIVFLLRLFYAQTIICIHRINQVCKASLYATTWDFEAVALVNLTGNFNFLSTCVDFLSVRVSMKGWAFYSISTYPPDSPGLHDVAYYNYFAHIWACTFTVVPETSFSFFGTPPRPVCIALTGFCQEFLHTLTSEILNTIVRIEIYMTEFAR